MSGTFMLDEQELISFKSYLLKVARISPATASDYVKRIITICKEEKIDFSALQENINKLAEEYTEGEKKELGKRSHNSYRSALLQFQRFVGQGGTVSKPTAEPKYHFEVNQVPGEGFGTIKLYDEDHNLLDTQMTLDMKTHSSAEGSRDIAEKCIKMMFDHVYNKNADKLYEVLGTLDCSLAVSGKNIRL